MSYSSGTRSLLGEAAMWVVVAGMCAGMLTYHSELTALMRLALGEPPAEQTAQAAADAEALAAKSGSGGSAVELRAGQNGHFHTTAEINGRDVDVMVDTGASMVAIPYEAAAQAGIYIRDSDYTGYVSTANGRARVAPVTLDRVSIGEITVRNVEAVVSEPGALNVTLLGMTFLGRLDRVDMRSGTLMLQE